jgi:hypothetical protein
MILGSSTLAGKLSALDAGTGVLGELSGDLTAPGIPFNRMLFGQFLEHFQRQVYGGVFDPGSPLADKNGFRTDVIQALRELKVPIVRWPGGCFASAYHWREGVGKDRHPSFDKAWGVEDPNTFDPLPPGMPTASGTMIGARTTPSASFGPARSTLRMPLAGVLRSTPSLPPR